MEFSEVQSFFKSWGMYPIEEDCSEDDLNPEVIEQGINRKCYERLCEDAGRLGGESFRTFCSRAVDATDDQFYLEAETWADLEDEWDQWSKN